MSFYLSKYFSFSSPPISFSRTHSLAAVKAKLLFLQEVPSFWGYFKSLYESELLSAEW
jgi:hypothetical protein